MSLLLLLRTNVGGGVGPVEPGVFGDPRFTRSVGGVSARVGDVPVSGVAARIGDVRMPGNGGNWS